MAKKAQAAEPKHPHEKWLVFAAVVVTALASILSASIGLYVRSDLRQVHLDVNSRLTELLDTTRAKARLEGIDEGERRETP